MTCFKLIWLKAMRQLMTHLINSLDVQGCTAGINEGLNYRQFSVIKVDTLAILQVLSETSVRGLNWFVLIKCPIL